MITSSKGSVLAISYFCAILLLALLANSKIACCSELLFLLLFCHIEKKHAILKVLFATAIMLFAMYFDRNVSYYTEV